MDVLEIPASQKAQLHRVADLLLVIYNTLVEMRYLEPEDVNPGPHDVSQLMPLYESLGLAPAVIYLYSILPYARPPQNEDEKGFFQGSRFADFLNRHDVERGRDPLHADPQGDDWNADNGPYMRPWYTPLCMLGNHDSMILYDTRTDKICITDHESGGSSDPNIDSRFSEEADELDGGSQPDQDENGGDEGGNSNSDGMDDENPNDHGPNGEEYDDSDSGISVMGDEEEDDEEEEDGGEVEEDGMIAGVDARSAAAVLRDINCWFREHKTRFYEWMDGDGDRDIKLADLYKRYGWPDEFDGDAFEVAFARREASAGAKFNIEESLRRAERRKNDAASLDRDMERHRAEIAAAPALDEAWAARWHLFRAERERGSLARQSQEEEAKMRSEKDLPLMEYEKLREGVDYDRRRKAKDKMEEEEEEEEKKKRQTEANEEPLRRQRPRCVLRTLPRDARRAMVRQWAAEAARADAVRSCGPDRVAASDDEFYIADREKAAANVRRRRAYLESSERDVAAFRQWAGGLPPGMAATRAKVEAAIARAERHRDACQETVAQMEKWLAENFGADDDERLQA